MNIEVNSFIVGIAASIIGWWLVNFFISPKLSISKKIAVTHSGQYQIGIKNKSCLFDVCNMYAYVRFNFANGNHYSTGIGQILLLDKCRIVQIKRKRKNTKSSILLSLGNYRGANGELLPAEMFFESSDNKTNGTIDVYVIGHNGLYGSAKKLCKKQYCYDDVLKNSFIKRGTVKVVEMSVEYDTQI